MKKIFVEYNAYLSDLYKREENVGKSEKELILENKLYERAYTVTKCGPRSRQKLNLDYTPYYVKPVLSLHGNKLSDIAYFNDDCPPMRGLYRWHILDPICFDKDIRVTLQQIGLSPYGLFERQELFIKELLTIFI